MNPHSPGRDPSDSRDGVPACTLCSRPASPETTWCSIAEGLVCDDCCARLRDRDPSAVIEALSHADIALSLAEAHEACVGCPGRSGSAIFAPVEDPGDRGLPS